MQFFDKDMIRNATMSKEEAEKFRAEATKHTLVDPVYEDSITVYAKTDGTIMMDSIETGVVS